MAPHDDIAVEAQEQMLADCLNPFQDAPVDRSGDAGREPAWVWALRLDALSDEHLEAVRDPMEAVALGHAQPSSADASSSRALKIASENVG